MPFLSSVYLYCFGLWNGGWKEENGIIDLAIPYKKTEFLLFTILVLTFDQIKQDERFIPLNEKCDSEHTV